MHYICALFTIIGDYFWNALYMNCIKLGTTLWYTALYYNHRALLQHQCTVTGAEVVVCDNEIALKSAANFKISWNPRQGRLLSWKARLMLLWNVIPQILLLYLLLVCALVAWEKVSVEADWFQESGTPLFSSNRPFYLAKVPNKLDSMHQIYGGIKRIYLVNKT